MLWSRVIFILINDQIFNFDPVEASSCGFFIPFDMTLEIFDSLFSIWYDHIFQTYLTYFQPGTQN